MPRKTKEQKLEIVSAWVNRHADELANDLNLLIDEDHPQWYSLEKDILIYFEVMSGKRYGQALEEIEE